jgi:cytochrome P450
VMPRDVREKIGYHMMLNRVMVMKKLEGENKGKRADFIDAALRAEKGEGLSEKEVEVNTMVLIFAGAETTASAISGVLGHLLLPENRGVLERVTGEVRGKFAKEEDVTVNSTSDLAYLNAVISEGLRMAPPVVIGVPRVTPKGGATVAERFVPAGTYVAVNQFAAFRSPSNFAEPDRFDPDRFTTPKEGDNMAILQPFGVGRQQCLGMRLAWVELRFVLARLLYTFDMEAVDVNAIPSWAEQKTFIFWEKEALLVTLKAR